MLSMKDLVFKERPVRKLVDWYVGLYIIEEVVFVIVWECGQTLGLGLRDKI